MPCPDGQPEPAARGFNLIDEAIAGMAVLFPYWSRNELIARSATERDRFIDRYKRTLRQGYAATERECAKEVVELFNATDYLRSLGQEENLFQQRPKLLVPARYICSPPISSDTFKIVAAADGPAKTIASFLDRERFPWLKTGKRITSRSAEVRAAVQVTAKLMAQQRAATAARGAASRDQEARVRAVLGKSKLRFVEPKVIRQRLTEVGDNPRQGLTGKNYQEALKRGEYTREFPLAGTKCDVPVRLSNGDLLPIECKVSNTEVNSVKRLNRETGGKHDRWRNAFGSQLRTGAVLGGVFKVLNLQQAQDEGILIFFDYELERSLAGFIRAGGEPRPAG
jgi:XamI restriction endonuclease